MASSHTLLVACFLATMTTAYGLSCYSGAIVSGIGVSVEATGCTACGSTSDTFLSLTTITHTCYTYSSCSSGCCYTDLCNSDANADANAGTTPTSSLVCYSGATVLGIQDSTTETGCTACGSTSATFLSLTTITHTCYTYSSCSSGCCYTNLCNSDANADANAKPTLSLVCHSGATVLGIQASITETGCTACGSISATLYYVTTITHICYKYASCSSDCCYTDLCNSGTKPASSGIVTSFLIVGAYMLL